MNLKSNKIQSNARKKMCPCSFKELTPFFFSARIFQNTAFIKVLLLSVEALIKGHIILYGIRLPFEHLPIYCMGIYNNVTVTYRSWSTNTTPEYCVYLGVGITSPLTHL